MNSRPEMVSIVGVAIASCTPRPICNSITMWEKKPRKKLLAREPLVRLGDRDEVTRQSISSNNNFVESIVYHSMSTSHGSTKSSLHDHFLSYLAAIIISISLCRSVANFESSSGLKHQGWPYYDHNYYSDGDRCARPKYHNTHRVIARLPTASISFTSLLCGPKLA